MAEPVVGMLWSGGAWQAALQEARGWLAHAEGRNDEARQLWSTAADAFTSAGQPRDAARRRELN